MEKKEEILEKNIVNIRVGDTFKSETSLIRELLGIKEVTGGRNKESYINFIKQYVNYEKTKRTTYEIKITEIYNEKKEKSDGRKNNKGGNNRKYIDYVIWLMQDHGSDILTSKQVVKKIYDFDFDLAYGTIYTSGLSQLLKSTIKTPCKKVGGNPKQIYMVDSSNQYADIILDVEWDKVKLWEILQLLNRKPLQKEVFKECLCMVNIYDTDISVIDFAKDCLSQKVNIETFVGNMPPSGEMIKADACMTKAIDNLKEGICRNYGVKGNYQYTYEWEKGKDISKIEKIIYQILGWQRIFKAWDIVVDNPIKLSLDEKKYYQDELKKLFQGKMAKVLEKNYSSYIYRENRVGRLADGYSQKGQEAKAAFKKHREIFGDSQYIDYFISTFEKKKKAL